jgi:hypothetical protein
VGSSLLTKRLPLSFFSEGGGYGMFASRKIESGEVIFTEKALAGMQQAENRAYVLACACCHRFTGSLALQAGVLGNYASTLPSTCILSCEATKHWYGLSAVMVEAALSLFCLVDVWSALRFICFRHLFYYLDLFLIWS